MGTSISFPSRAIGSNRDYREFRKEQALKSHVKNANWKIQRTRLQSLAMSQNYKDILDFAGNTLNATNNFPLENLKLVKQKLPLIIKFESINVSVRMDANLG